MSRMLNAIQSYTEIGSVVYRTAFSRIVNTPPHITLPQPIATGVGGKRYRSKRYIHYGKEQLHGFPA